MQTYWLCLQACLETILPLERRLHMAENYDQLHQQWLAEDEAEHLAQVQLIDAVVRGAGHLMEENTKLQGALQESSERDAKRLERARIRCAKRVERIKKLEEIKRNLEECLANQIKREKVPK